MAKGDKSSGEFDKFLWEKLNDGRKAQGSQSTVSGRMTLSDLARIVGQEGEGP
jgi:hypothetical protein